MSRRLIDVFRSWQHQRSWECNEPNLPSIPFCWIIIRVGTFTTTWGFVSVASLTITMRLGLLIPTELYQPAQSTGAPKGGGLTEVEKENAAVIPSCKAVICLFSSSPGKGQLVICGYRCRLCPQPAVHHMEEAMLSPTTSIPARAVRRIRRTCKWYIWHWLRLKEASATGRGGLSPAPAVR